MELQADVKGERLLLEQLLGETRARFRQRKTKFASAQQLIDVDLEIRDVLARPPSADLQVDVRRLLARLRALDPH
jgi:hypothetical protein